MSNKYLWYIIIILIVLLAGGGITWWAVTQNAADTTDTEDVIDITDDEDEDIIEEEEEEVVEEEEEEVAEEEEEEDTGSANFTNFTQNNQTVGTASSQKYYDLQSISNSAMTGYHRITFNIRGTSTSSTPYVTAQYKSEVSSIRVVVNGLKTDTSGIDFQDAVSINKDGVNQIYHNISGVEGVAHYDIGISKAADYYLHLEKNGSSEWKVYLDVKYPGASSAGTIDLGSTTFSKTKQTITGGTSADGAGISQLYWNNKTITFEVTGSATKPLPNCYAEYQGGVLKLVFTDLASNVFGSPKDFGSIGGLGSVTMVKSGNTSTFSFNSITNSNFKLSGTQGPNQIMLEVQ